MVEVNKISEIYKGHYHVILDFPAPQDLYNIIDESYKYVWGVQHIESPLVWSKYDVPLFGVKQPSFDKIKLRNIEMEYLLETSDFKDMIPQINRTVTILQVNSVPPYYLDLRRLSGKTKYDLLRDKVDYLFELDMPAAIDYTPLVSPSVAFLESVINKMNITNTDY